MNLFTYLIIALASFRYAYFISQEVAPFHLMETLRFYWSKELWGGRNLNYALDISCFYCVSVWTSIAAYYLHKAEWGATVNTIAAIAALPLIVFEIMQWLEYRNGAIAE
jgi:hypothetical protein